MWDWSSDVPRGNRTGETGHAPLPSNVPKRGCRRRSGRILRRVGEHPASAWPKSDEIGDRNIYDRQVLDRSLDELARQETPKSSSLRQSMRVKLRYVERRVDRSGGERWYWHRRGHRIWTDEEVAR